MAQNMVIWQSDNFMVDGYTLTASSAQANYPVTNLQNANRKITWRSANATVTQWIQGDKPVPSPNQYMRGATRKAGIALINHNQTANVGTNPRLQLWNSSLVEVYSGYFQAIDYFAIGSEERTLIDEIRPYPIRVFYIDVDVVNAISLQPENIARWRVTFSPDISGSPPAYWELGRLLMGENFVPKNNFYAGNAMLFGEDQTRVNISYGMDQTSDNRPKARGISIQMPELVDISDVAQWLRLAQVVGKRIPILFDIQAKGTGDIIYGIPEKYEAVINKSWQIYGTNNADIALSPQDANNMRASGKLDLVEQA